MDEHMISGNQGQDESALDLNLSVLTDRGGSDTSVTDKSGIYIFDIETEARIKQYIQMEQDRLLYYKEEVFEGKAKWADAELETIKGQIFAMSSTSNRSFENRNPGLSEKGNTAWFIVLPVFCIFISLSYGRIKKKEREKRIADIDNSYDE